MKCENCSHENHPGARFCENCGHTLGSPAHAHPTVPPVQESLPNTAQAGSERKPVTILFTDIVNSTGLAEGLDPEEWKEVVQGAHRLVSQVVYSYEGTIAQFLGDGVLAFFGGQTTHEDDPVRAVQAGLDIQGMMVEYAHQLAGYVDSFQMRVGIHSGLVVVGPVGNGLHSEYLAVGDAVNLAARLQSAAQPGTVLISEATARLVKAAVALQDLGKIQLKGKAEAVHVFLARERKAGAGSGRGIEGLSSALVGRDRELSILLEAMQAVSQGRGQIVVVMGEAGIGKSRLVEEAREQANNLQSPIHNLNFLEGRALSYGGALSFWTIQQLILSDLGLSQGDPEIKIRTALRRRTSELCGERAESALPYLASLMGLQLEGEAAERLRALDGETLKRQTIWTIADYFAAVGRRAPTVLVFEDLHWADPSTLEGVEELFCQVEQAPLMILLLMRPERGHASWRVRLQAQDDFGTRYTEIHLQPLTDAQQSQLLYNLLEINELPAEVRRLVQGKAEGNPFYLEEILRSLIEQGAIIQVGDTWQASLEISQVTIPDTVQGVLLARIDRLEEDVRRTLQIASVIGRNFLYRLLQAIDQAEKQIDHHLALLQRQDLVREHARLPELEYIFKHSLTQEAAYNSLLAERRKEFHRKVGEALEALFSDRLEEFLGLLAHHFEAADEKDKAISYLVRAGDQARWQDASLEAIDFYQRALRLMDKSEAASSTWRKIGLVYTTNFQFAEAHQAFEKAFSEQQVAPGLPRGRGEPQKILRIAHHYSMIHTLDPAMDSGITFALIDRLFAGLLEYDEETNLRPHIARSWEVLDGGKRYLFHLREDVLWTDGVPLTAHDFEWTWKYNLSPGRAAPFADFLDVVDGARAYRLGGMQEGHQVGVRALDAWTLEVLLEQPVAYFLYLVALPVTYPLPRHVIEQFGAGWWRPEHIVSSNAFRLERMDDYNGRMVRNPHYFGDFPGNLDAIEWRTEEDTTVRRQLYVESAVDISYEDAIDLQDPRLPKEEFIEMPTLVMRGIFLIPSKPPLDDLRVRQALACSLDRNAWVNSWMNRSVLPAYGGLVPPGISGHTPDLAIPYDPQRAAALLEEAGYPDGRGLPPLDLFYFPWQLSGNEFLTSWQNLGVRFELHPLHNPFNRKEIGNAHLHMFGWKGDFPDPHDFLRIPMYFSALKGCGVVDERYLELTQEAAHTFDRAKRMDLYRQADRWLVVERAVFVPILYVLVAPFGYVKPWVKALRPNAFGGTDYRRVRLEMG